MDTRSSSTTRRFSRLLGLTALGSLAFAPSGFSANEPSLLNGERKSFAYSWEQERQLGAESDKDIVETLGLYDDAKVQNYVNAVGQRLIEVSHFSDAKAPEIYRNTKFTFRVIDSPVVNAFAAPGGYVYVTRGLLAHVQNEAQLAVVLGHEIAHVAARHSSQQARRSQWTQLGVMAGAILGQKVLGERAADLAPALLGAGGQAAQLFLLRYSREAEHESDNLGVSYATRAGYAAGESARFFQSLQRLAGAEGKVLPTWQSTHPDPGDRAQRVVQLASATPAELRTNVGEEQFLRHIENLVVGDDPRGGFARNGVFYHPVMQFQLPVAPGWQLDNQHAAVLMAEPGGKGMIGLRLAAATRARDAALQFAQQSKIRILTSGDTAVNGLPTTVIIGEASTDQGAVGVWNAFIEHQGKVFSLLGYAPQNVFEQLRPTFENVAAGFSPLREPAFANVQPARLKIGRADRPAPFASFVPTSLPPDLTADEIAIMNQLALNETVPAGRMLKLPDVPPPVSPSPVAAPDYRPQSPQNYPTQPGYPPAQTYPGQSSSSQPSNYPSSPYPPQSYPTYPPNAQPPATNPNYPAGNYPSAPPSNYPSGTANYPSSPYPQPPANTYPSSNPNFPSPQGQPTNTPAPSNPGYPSSPYPPQSYPPPANSQPGAPQFPQPPASGTSNSRPSSPPASTPPVWPRP